MIDDIGLLQLFRDEMPGPSTDAWARARSKNRPVPGATQDGAGPGCSRSPGWPWPLLP